ncbi:MAG: hypothetical protein OXF74_12875 [Rhodobacteraceae bacterium]|nr:hypothetical protein [Paracoccaceae bacterium]
MNDLQKHELLELYKLHSEFADRVSQRREGANRLFVSLLVGLTLFLGIFFRFGSNDEFLAVILMFAGLIGIALSVSWYIVIRSYRQLNTGKFQVLQELEKKLSFQFFEREWKVLESGTKPSRYWKLTVVETSLPVIFFVLSSVLATIGLYQL